MKNGGAEAGKKVAFLDIIGCLPPQQEEGTKKEERRHEIERG